MACWRIYHVWTIFQAVKAFCSHKRDGKSCSSDYIYIYIFHEMMKWASSNCNTGYKYITLHSYCGAFPSARFHYQVTASFDAWMIWLSHLRLDGFPRNFAPRIGGIYIEQVLMRCSCDFMGLGDLGGLHRIGMYNAVGPKVDARLIWYMYNILIWTYIYIYTSTHSYVYFYNETKTCSARTSATC